MVMNTEQTEKAARELGHELGEWKMVENGYQYAKCKICGIRAYVFKSSPSNKLGALGFKCVKKKKRR